MDQEIAQMNALLNEGGNNQNNNLVDGMERMDIVENHNNELQRLARAGNHQHNQVNQVVHPPDFQNAQVNAEVPGQQGVQNPGIVEDQNGHLQQQNAGLEQQVHQQALQVHVINGQGQDNLNAGQHNLGRADGNAGNVGQHLLGPLPLQYIPVNQQNNVLMQGPIMRVNRNRNGRRAPYAAANSEMRRNASRMATFLWNMAKECTFVPNRNNNQEQENNEDQEN